MSQVNWKEVGIHLATQVGTLALAAFVASLAKADWSALGAYAPYAQVVVAAVTSVYNQAVRKA